MSFKNRNEGVVFSTEQGRMCPTCQNPISDCSCKQQHAEPEGDGIVRVSRETKGRKGKGVTLITGVPLDHKGLKALCKQLKKRIGTGGSIKDGVIEIQGDHRELMLEELAKKGWKVKASGG